MRTPGRSARRTLVLLVSVAVFAGAAGWGASLLVSSPRQAAADAAAPPPTVLTAAVELRVIQETQVTRGVVEASQTTSVHLRAPLEGQPVITAVHVKSGDAIQPGQPILDVAGRPVFAIPGETPVYRPLQPGMRGEDVKQLQRFLSNMGLSVAVDGVYGASTSHAVTEWYQRAGYTPMPAEPDGEERIQAAKDLIRQSTRAVEDARDGSDSALTNHRVIERAEEDLARAKEALSDILAVTGPAIGVSELTVIPSFPATVRQVAVSPGDSVREDALSITSGPLQVRATLSEQMSGLVRPGQPVELVSESLGRKEAARVGELGRATSPPGEEEMRTPPTVRAQFSVVPDHELGPEWSGQDVRVTVTGAESDSPVLVVPLSAVSSDVSHRTRVTVEDEKGNQREVEVMTGVVGAGFVQVTPTVGDLQVGELVRIGHRAATSPAPRPSGTSE